MENPFFLFLVSFLAYRRIVGSLKKRADKAELGAESLWEGRSARAGGGVKWASQPKKKQERARSLFFTHPFRYQFSWK